MTQTTRRMAKKGLYKTADSGLQGVLTTQRALVQNYTQNHWHTNACVPDHAGSGTRKDKETVRRAATQREASERTNRGQLSKP